MARYTDLRVKTIPNMILFKKFESKTSSERHEFVQMIVPIEHALMIDDVLIDDVSVDGSD